MCILQAAGNLLAKEPVGSAFDTKLSQAENSCGLFLSVLPHEGPARGWQIPPMSHFKSCTAVEWAGCFVQL